MSILLDALRKSEDRKHRGEVPTIHSSVGLEVRKPRSLKPGMLILFLLPVVLVIAWFAWKSGSGPEQQSTPVVQSQAQEGNTTGDQLPASTAAQSAMPSAGEPASGPDSASGQALPVEPPAMQPAEPADQSLPVSAGSQSARTPVEKFTAPQVDSGGTPQPGVAETALNTNDASQSRAVDSGARTRVTQPEPEPAREERDFRQPSLDAISYWRLPQSVRDEIGQLKISVLVYSDEPESRFVIMNGQRLSEGDEPRAGLVLREISREGAIFSYRLYRFLVAR